MSAARLRLIWQPLMLFLFSALAAPAAEQPRVVALHAESVGAAVSVSFRIENGMSAEVLERIHSGIPVRFRHRVEIQKRRSFWLAPSRVLARAIVDTHVSYDSLTHRYDLRRELRSTNRWQKIPDREDHEVTESVDEMNLWMTALSSVQLVNPSVPLPDEPLRVRVESYVGRRYLLLVFPASVTAAAETRLER